MGAFYEVAEWTRTQAGTTVIFASRTYGDGTQVFKQAFPDGLKGGEGVGGSSSQGRRGGRERAEDRGRGRKGKGGEGNTATGSQSEWMSVCDIECIISLMRMA